MCGVIGVIGSPKSAEEVYQGLLLMQHRGQDAAGILSSQASSSRIHLHKKLGLVDAIFNREILDSLPGEISLGHARYSTIGHNYEEDIQPSTISYPFGIGLAHNGNIINTSELRDYLLKSKHRNLFSDNDSEILVNLLADELSEEKAQSFSFEALAGAVSKLQEKTQGAYSVVACLAGQGFFAFRDPYGIRPLVMGKKKNQEIENSFSYCFASESNVLNYLGYEDIRDIEPGELVFVSLTGQVFSQILHKETPRPCMFEWVYFSNPESVISGKNVYHARLQMGLQLGEQVKASIQAGEISPDLVVPVPETSRVSAISLSEYIQVPYRELLIKNRYIQRSFILNNPESRARAVERKLSPVRGELEGKKVLLVDDSIVRGTTSRHIVRMLKNCGAKEVYLAVSCPPIVSPCYYGIDFPFSEDLLAFQRSKQEIQEQLGADKVIYLTEGGLRKSIGCKSLCSACVDGNYPSSYESAESFKNQRKHNKEKQKDL